VLGPLARDLPDMIRLQNVISGPAPGVMNSLRPKLDLPLSYAGVKGMRIAYSPNQGWARVSENVRRNTEAALAVLERQGAVITKVDLDLGVTGNDIRKVLLEALLSGVQGADIAELVSCEPEGSTHQLRPSLRRAGGNLNGTGTGAACGAGVSRDLSPRG